MSVETVRPTAPDLQSATLFTLVPKPLKRVPEFFTVQINNDLAHKARLNATRRLAEWCDARRVGRKQLAGLRMLFDWTDWDRRSVCHR